MASIVKDSVFKSKSKRMPEDYNFTPGPGSYKTVTSMPRANVIKDEKNSPFYQIIQSGAKLTKMQPYASDKVDRFNYLNMPEIGMQKRGYGKRDDVDEKNLDMRFKKKVQKGTLPQKKREKSWETAPSIPAAHNSMLFLSEEDDSDQDGTTNGSSVIKKVPRQNKDGKEKAEVSPFTYKPDVNHIKKASNGPAWGMSKSQRLTFEKNAKKLATGETIGPGKYDFNNMNVGNSGVADTSKGPATVYQNQSSFFKSNVERMAYMEPKVKTFVAGKLVKGSPHMQGNIGSEQVTIVPEISPGPGDYFTMKDRSTFKQDFKPHHLQFFSSTEERTVDFGNKKAKEDVNFKFIGEFLNNF